MTGKLVQDSCRMSVKQELSAKIAANAAKIDAVEQRLTAKIEANTAKIEENGRKIDANAAKIEENGRKIDANTAKIEENGHKIDANAAKIEENGHKIDANTKRLDKLTIEVLNNRELIEQRATREELNKRFDELVTGIDGVMAILRGWEQERTATNARLDRVEVDVDKNKRDIKEIKTKLAMP